jgi:hypothetical protein
MEDDQGTEDLFGEDWRSKVQAKGGRQYEDPLAVSLERSRERGRGREATAPETIPPLGWRDILWRVLEGILADRILYTSGGVAFFTLLAFFPAVGNLPAEILVVRSAQNWHRQLFCRLGDPLRERASEFAQTTSHVAQGHGSASSRRLSLL